MARDLGKRYQEKFEVLASQQKNTLYVSRCHIGSENGEFQISGASQESLSSYEIHSITLSLKIFNIVLIRLLIY